MPSPPAQVALLGLAAWLAWRPVEIFAWSAVVIALVILGLTVWGWQRSSTETVRAGAWATVALGALVISGLAGHDPSAALTEVPLLTAMAALIWLASREAPPARWPAVLALVISGLSIWGVLQLTAGPEYAETILLELPEALRAAGSERLASGRAFASQPLPSHLAVLLATGLPLLLARLRWHWSAVPWIAGFALCVVGLALTRSPIGVGLALAACAALGVVRGGRMTRLTMVLLVAVFISVVVARGDVLELEPVSLRLDNWRTAVWVWSTAPAAGVGFGGFGQVAQTVPFAVGNRPRFAHSLPLEWLAELGPVGLVAILAAGVALWRLIQGLWPLRPDLAVAVAVVPLHNLADFSMHGSGVLLPWAVLVGWALAFRRTAPVRGTLNFGRPIAVAVASLALAATVLHATSVMVSEAATLRHQPEERLAGAFEARRLAPWRADPLFEIAVAALESGNRANIAEASEVLERMRWLRPYSASLADLRGHLAQALGEIPAAAAEAWTARVFNPSNPVYQQRASELFLQLRDDDAVKGR